MRPTSRRLPRHLALLVTGTVAVGLLAPAAQAGTTDVDEAREQVAQLGAEVEAASAEYAAVEARLSAQQNQVAAAQARVASQTTLVQMLESQVVDLAVQTYKSGGVDPQLSLLATGSTELSDTGSMLGLLTERRAVTLADVRQAEAELERLQQEEEAELVTVEALRTDLASRRADIEARLAGAQDVLAVAQAEEERRVAVEEARRAAEASRSGRGSAAAAPAGGSGLLATPTPGRQATYGWRTHPVYGDRRFHSGMDIITGCGTPVVAAADGVVSSAGWNGSYGNIIVVDHGASAGGALSTAYAHLQEYVVSSGPVSQGEVIGYVGTTGLSTGCHLHFEVRVDGEDVDPARFI